MATFAPDITQPSLLDGLTREAPRVRPRPEPGGTARVERSGATLDDLVTGAWGSLVVTGAAACPVCGGDVVPRYGAGPQPVAGACRSCGTEVS